MNREAVFRRDFWMCQWSLCPRIIEIFINNSLFRIWISWLDPNFMRPTGWNSRTMDLLHESSVRRYLFCLLLCFFVWIYLSLLLRAGWRRGKNACLPSAVAWVPFLDLVSHVIWVCCWFSSLRRGFFSRSSGSSPPLRHENQHSKFQFDLEIVDKKSHLVKYPLRNSHYYYSYYYYYYYYYFIYFFFMTNFLLPILLSGMVPYDTRVLQRVPQYKDKKEEGMIARKKLCWVEWIVSFSKSLKDVLISEAIAFKSMPGKVVGDCSRKPLRFVSFPILLTGSRFLFFAQFEWRDPLLTVDWSISRLLG